jgi:hypothetical protein
MMREALLRRLEALEESRRMRDRAACQISKGPNDFISYRRSGEKVTDF